MKKHTTLGYQTLSWAEKRMGGHNDFLRLARSSPIRTMSDGTGKGTPAA